MMSSAHNYAGAWVATINSMTVLLEIRRDGVHEVRLRQIGLTAEAEAETVSRATRTKTDTETELCFQMLESEVKDRRKVV